MHYALAADAVLILHGLFVAFVIFGGLLALWRPRLAWLHLPALAWGATVIAMGWICPLTPLENHLRALAGQGTYDGGFIQHYLWPLIYPPGITRGMQIALAVLLAAGNAAIYLALWGRRKKVRADARIR
ncbi:DUF2784 domain-containing protein [Pusillimonas noertemannii]|uniref:Uncharacterized protein DUF2784 n=1 Tax=Pusillimonas noertemannii TaxID=305977 RepID=A0A2U1CIX2_9BURK|nr:DUF2784 domain-containing protein [Pusillimonas noertemannii]NYT69981.1 DUF2784 domain-containing protein [Pusillimonas noertemannii]PVY60932.1 uncharacterized protein DUF2784 [Pusillimonas noertemannii]TFL08408.1 DUF2784 domain-containing protein [Pusillimonas noertemannii]